MGVGRGLGRFELARFYESPSSTCVCLLAVWVHVFVCVYCRLERVSCVYVTRGECVGRPSVHDGRSVARPYSQRSSIKRAYTHMYTSVCVCVYMYQVNILVIRLYCRVYAMDEALIACTCWHEASIRKHITISLKIFCAPTLIFFFLHIIPVLILSFSRVGYMETHAHGYPMQTCAYNVIKIWIFNVN